MGLSRRQAEEIEKIINEEVQGVIAVRKLRDSQLVRGRLLEGLLSEEGPNPERVDKGMLANALQHNDEMYEVTLDNGQETLRRFLKEAYSIIADVLSRHAMDVTHGGHEMAPGWTAQTVLELEDVSNDISEAQFECANNISEELMKLVDVYVRVAAEQTAKAREEY